MPINFFGTELAGRRVSLLASRKLEHVLLALLAMFLLDEVYLY
jgi:hypothetical protein